MQRSIQQELEQIKNQGLYRSTRCIDGRQSSWISINGKKVLLLCSNNYLGLAEHPKLIDASIRATELFGTSSGASRLVSGTMELHEELERAVASFKKTDSALLFNSGYAANTGIIPAIVGRGDLIFSDRLNHASIIDGARLSGAKLIRYPHNDCNALERLLQLNSSAGRILIVTDGVFSMDGDIALLGDLLELKQKYSTLLMVDDAHGSGVLGAEGRGSAELLSVAEGVDIHMGTFGKAFGSYGAYAAVSAELRELLLNRSRSLIFSTSLPPSVLAASLAALELVQSETGLNLREKLLANSARFIDLLRLAGFAVNNGGTQIIPLVTAAADITMQFSTMLLEEGIFAQGIRPPTVPLGASLLRFTMMATHTEEDLNWSTERIAAVGKRLGII